MTDRCPKQLEVDQQPQQKQWPVIEPELRLRIPPDVFHKVIGRILPLQSRILGDLLNIVRDAKSVADRAPIHQQRDEQQSGDDQKISILACHNG